MEKISNWDMKLGYTICMILFLLVLIPFLTVLIIYKKWEIAGILIFVILMLLFEIIFKMKWPESIAIDKEKIVVYRFGKEINRISWQNVTEIFKKDVTSTKFRVISYYYLSDGQDRFLNAKDGNEHFVKFRCSRNKDAIFSKFTDLSIKEIDSDN